ncbi:MAG: hypothetical protein WCG05_00015 [Alphaproteobacteria bacterium]
MMPLKAKSSNVRTLRKALKWLKLITPASRAFQGRRDTDEGKAGNISDFPHMFPSLEQFSVTHLLIKTKIP